MSWRGYSAQASDPSGAPCTSKSRVDEWSVARRSAGPAGSAPSDKAPQVITINHSRRMQHGQSQIADTRALSVICRRGMRLSPSGLPVDKNTPHRWRPQGHAVTARDVSFSKGKDLIWLFAWSTFYNWLVIKRCHQVWLYFRVVEMLTTTFWVSESLKSPFLFMNQLAQLI